MILTNCAACAAPLAHDAPRCRRCHTRYCSSTCQYDHWRRGQEEDDAALKANIARLRAENARLRASVAEQEALFAAATTTTAVETS